MKSLSYGIIVGMLLLPLAAFAEKKAETACDNSLIILRNHTKTHFTVNDYSPLSGTLLTLLRGPAEIPPGKELRFKVHSGMATWGDSLGNIQIEGISKKYNLFYVFDCFWGYADCSVRYRISTVNDSASPEKYLFDCEDGAIKSPATLTCTINSPKYGPHA